MTVADDILHKTGENVREHGVAHRSATVDQVWRSGGEQKVRCIIGQDNDGGPWYTPWQYCTEQKGPHREQNKYAKGQNMVMHGTSANNREATATHWSENDQFPEPDHANDYAHTWQYGGHRQSNWIDVHEHWLASNGQAAGGDTDSDKSTVMHRIGNKSNSQDVDGPWEGPPSEGGQLMSRWLQYLKGQSGDQTPNLSQDQHLLQHGKNTTRFTTELKQINTIIGQASTTVASMLNGTLIKHEVDQGSGGGNMSNIGSSLMSAIQQIQGLVSQVTSLAAQGGSTAAGVFTLTTGIGFYASQINTSLMSSIISEVTTVAGQLYQAGETDLYNQLTELGQTLSGVVDVNGIGNLADLPGQIETLANEVAANPLDSALFTELNVAVSSLDAVIGSVSGVAGTLEDIASSVNSNNALNSLELNFSSLIQNAASMIGSMQQQQQGQPIHEHWLDLQKGVFHGAFNKQHTTLWDNGGVTHTSGTAVTSSAPTISENGQHYVGGNDHVKGVDFAGDHMIPGIPPPNTSFSEPYHGAKLFSNIRDFSDDTLDKVLKLRVKHFHKKKMHYNHKGEFSIDVFDPPTPSFGVDLKEAHELFPEMTVDHGNGFFSLSEGKVAVVTLRAFQEYVVKTDARIAALEATVAQLAARDGHASV